MGAEEELTMVEVELTMRVAGDECCRELKNVLVALVCGKGESHGK